MGMLRWLMQGAIRLYQLVLVPVMPRGGCRFHPSCSEYAHEAVGRHGPLTGGWLAVKRILRCHPWGPAGIDPVPPAAADPPGRYDVKGGRA